MKKLVSCLGKKSLCCVAFLQALGLIFYCGLIGLIFWQGNHWFGTVPNFWGPLLFLILFVASALISALIVLGYPFILFWEKKQTTKALRLVLCTTAWLTSFVLLFILIFAFS